MSTINERVAAGAEWLDEHAPGWEHKLSFQDLEMESPCTCVLGQVFFEEALAAGIYGSWLDRENDQLVQKPAGFHYIRRMEGAPDPRDLGFDSGHGELWEYDELRDAWTELVKDRFDNGTLSG